MSHPISWSILNQDKEDVGSRSEPQEWGKILGPQTCTGCYLIFSDFTNQNECRGGIEVTFQNRSVKCRLSPSNQEECFSSCDDENSELGRSPAKVSWYSSFRDWVYSVHKRPQGFSRFFVQRVLHKPQQMRTGFLQDTLQRHRELQNCLFVLGLLRHRVNIIPNSITVLPSLQRSQISKLSSCYIINFFQWNCNLMASCFNTLYIIFWFNTTTHR